jgi:hypothetical protein
VFLGYARGLQGEKITKIELSGVRKYFADGALEPQHVTLSLIGRFKQMEGGQQHLLPTAAETGSGFRIREWVEILLDEKARVGLATGSMFLKKDGKPAKAIYFKETLVEKLAWIQKNTSRIIPLAINLWQEFEVRRSMRKGATAETLNDGIDGPTIDANNGWRKVEAAKGKTPRFSMQQRYTQVFQDLRHQMRFRWAFGKRPRGVYNSSTKVLSYFWFFCLESSRSEKRQGNILMAHIISWGLACRDSHPLGHPRSNTI